MELAVAIHETTQEKSGSPLFSAVSFGFEEHKHVETTKHKGKEEKCKIIMHRIGLLYCRG